VPLNPLEITGGLAIGEGVGGAIADTVTPRLQAFKNDQWSKHMDVPLDAMQAALALVKGIPTGLDLTQEASFHGVNGNRLAVLEQLVRVYPGTAELLELWRRDRLTKDEVDAALHRQGYDDLYRAAVLDLFTGRLDPAIIATAIQRGIMADPGFLPVGPPTATGKVPAFPVSPLDPLVEAKARGIDEARLFVETAIVGLPLSLQEAASAYFRGIIELADFQRAVSEGNTRNEWGDAALAQARQILTASEYCELELRGYLTRDARLALTAQHGMSTVNSDHLFDVLGRSINVHQIVTAEARGGVYNGPSDQIPPAFLRALQRGNLRPEYYNLAYANRYSYPSAFVVRSLLQGGVITAAQGEQIFLDIGWRPDLAKQVAEHYGTATTAAVDPFVRSSRTSLVTALRHAYVLGDEDAASAQTILTAEGVAPATQTELLATWDRERSITRKELTPAQLKKAYKEAIVNPATGTAFTKDEVVAELVTRGFSTADATVFVET
jgi:hypothetical protein